MEIVKLETRIFARGRNLDSACCKEFTVSTDRKFTCRSVLALTVAVGALNYALFLYYSGIFAVVLSGIGFVGLVRTLWTVDRETLTLVVPIGLQMTSTTFLGLTSTASIPWCQLRNFMILDVIIGQQVVFLLAVQLKATGDDGETEERTLILFRDTKPRLAYLEKIYVELQTILDKECS